MTTPRQRSSLYVPGDRPERFEKALASGADAIIVDLEDSVSEAAKGDARDNAVAWLAEREATAAWVRVNNRPDLLSTDVAAVASLPCLGVVIPKATVEACSQTDRQVVALIETAVGVTQLRDIARLENVVRLALGEADLAADLGFHPSPDSREFASIRSQVVVESVAAGLMAPVGPVHTDLEDTEGLSETSAALRRQGFGGRSVIHPKQVEVVNRAFSPSASEVAWARQVIDSLGSSESVAVVEGEFVDAAVVRRAAAILANEGSP